MLLVATAARAQTLGIEQSHGPYARPALDSQLALAAARNGVLLAWSETDPASGRARVRTAMMDIGGHIVSPIATMPVLDAGADAYTPSLASNGTSFYLIQIEVRTNQATVGIPLDSSGRPSAAPRALIAGDTLTPSVIPSISVGWNGSSYMVTAPSGIYTVAQNGTLLASTPSTPPTARTWGGVTPRGFTTAVYRRQVTCFFFCNITSVREEVVWTSGTRSGIHLPAKPPAGASMVIAGNRSESLIAWITGLGIEYFVIADSGPRDVLVPALVDAGQELAMACSDRQCIIAYGTVAGDIYGLLIDEGRADYPKVFPIATSGRRESRPEITYAGSGLFFAGYFSDLPGEFRLAGRSVTTTSTPRRPSAGH